MSNQKRSARAELDADSPVCIDCAGGDPYLRDLLTTDLEKRRCALCKRSKRTVTLSELAAAIDVVFKKYVQPIENYFGRTEGSSPNELIYSILECDSDELVDKLVAELDSMQQYAIFHDGDVSLYDITSDYEITVPHSTAYEEDWNRFVFGVKHRGRFFLTDEQGYLEKLFSPVLRGELHGGEPPVVTFGAPDSIMNSIYRGRAANTKVAQQRIFENPKRELAPPPPLLRSAGRMNSSGIAAFYGATDIPTCVAELGIPFGGAAIVGRFTFERPVRILDFRQLSLSSPATSYFDPDLERKVAYAKFMRELRDTIRKPVLPGDEVLDYLPTQMIAEFLSRTGLDGIMFVSSRTPEAAAEATVESETGESFNDVAIDVAYESGVNVVLFSHAARVDGDMAGPQRHVLSVEEPLGMEDPLNLLHVEVSEDMSSRSRGNVQPEESDDRVESTLRLVESDIVLAIPKSIEYKIKMYKPSFMPRRTTRAEF